MITPSAVEKNRGSSPAESAPPVEPSAVPARNKSALKVGRPRVLAIGATAAIVLAGALTTGALPRWRRTQAVNTAAAEAAAAPPRVTVAVARPSATDAQRVLPGNSQP